MYFSGNLIIISGTTLAMVGLSWGGTRFPWTDVHVLAPLILGIVIIIIFCVFEVYVPKKPTVPFKVIANRTTASGYATSAVHGVTSIAIICKSQGL